MKIAVLLQNRIANGYNKLISGDELLQTASDTVRRIQMMTGDKMAYLECEDIPPLIAFYGRKGFHPFANRNLDRDGQELYIHADVRTAIPPVFRIDVGR